MQLPKNLASRYVQMPDNLMDGGTVTGTAAVAKLALESGVYKSKPPVEVLHASGIKQLVRPGLISWKDNEPTFRMVPNKETLNSAKAIEAGLQKGYERIKATPEFPGSKPPLIATPASVAKADAAMVKAEKDASEAAKVEQDAEGEKKEDKTVAGWLGDQITDVSKMSDEQLKAAIVAAGFEKMKESATSDVGKTLAAATKFEKTIQPFTDEQSKRAMKKKLMIGAGILATLVAAYLLSKKMGWL